MDNEMPQINYSPKRQLRETPYSQPLTKPDAVIVTREAELRQAAHG